MNDMTPPRQDPKDQIISALKADVARLTSIVRIVETQRNNAFTEHVQAELVSQVRLEQLQKAADQLKKNAAEIERLTGEVEDLSGELRLARERLAVMIEKTSAFANDDAEALPG